MANPRDDIHAATMHVLRLILTNCQPGETRDEALRSVMVARNRAFDALKPTQQDDRSR